MAAAPSYAATPVAWTGLVPSTADTNWVTPVHVTTLGTATSSGGSTGTKITEIDVICAGTTVAGLVNLFLYDGTAYHLHESVTIAAATPSATVAPVKQSLYYDNLVLPAGWSLACTATVVADESLIEVNAFGASL
jgi:hypothetical protein